MSVGCKRRDVLGRDYKRVVLGCGYKIQGVQLRQKWWDQSNILYGWVKRLSKFTWNRRRYQYGLDREYKQRVVQNVLGRVVPSRSCNRSRCKGI